MRSADGPFRATELNQHLSRLTPQKELVPRFMSLEDLQCSRTVEYHQHKDVNICHITESPLYFYSSVSHHSVLMYFTTCSTTLTSALLYKPSPRTPLPPHTYI